MRLHAHPFHCIKNEAERLLHVTHASVDNSLAEGYDPRHRPPRSPAPRIMTAPSSRVAPFRGLLLAALVGLTVTLLLLRNFESDGASESIVPATSASAVKTESTGDSLAPPGTTPESSERADESPVDANDPIDEATTLAARPAHDELFEPSGQTPQQLLDALQRQHEQFGKESDPDSFDFRGNDADYGWALATTSIASIMLLQGRAQFEPDPGSTGRSLVVEAGSRCFLAAGAKCVFPDGEFPVYDAIEDRMHKAHIDKQPVPPLTADQVIELERLYEAAHQALLAYR